MSKFTDKHGVFITVGDNVQAPEPDEYDNFNFEFVGYVADIMDNGNIIVEDQDSDFFEIEHNRLEII